MQAKNKNQAKKRQNLQIQADETQPEYDDAQKIIASKESTVQISSTEAEIYFEYLRKKISHQSNDPFSLPFLNLKFQQIQSWKGATQQLNLESRIYGMRVDNCHDSTIKLLNYVIRNQEEQIGENIGYDIENKQNDDKKNRERQANKQGVNFNLEKPEKLNGKVQIDKNLHNRSIWKTIFKKCQKLSQIQLNTIQISDNLSLNIDESKISLKSKAQQLNPEFEQKQANIYIEYGIINCLGISDTLSIFRELSTTRDQINRDIQQLIHRSNKKKKRISEEQVQDFRFDQQFGYHDQYFTQFYEQFNEMEKNHQRNKSQVFEQQDYQQQDRHNVFIPQPMQLHSLPIQNTTQMYVQNEIQYETLSDDSEQNQLYEPHKDIMFNTTIKKKKHVKKNQSGRIIKNQSSEFKIKFAQSTFFNRNQVFYKTKKRTDKGKNDNLVPINYVVIYENRNPFRKMKKANRNTQKVSHRLGLDQNVSHEVAQFNTNSFQPCERNQETQIQYLNETKNKLYEQSQMFVNTHERTYKNVSMKVVKNDIKNEIVHDKSLLLSKTLNLPGESEDLSYQQQDNSQGLQNPMGLKYFRQKMSRYDPLDILVSMLHIAYEQQVKLQPIYLPNQSKSHKSLSIVQDIVIMNAQSSFY